LCPRTVDVSAEIEMSEAQLRLGVSQASRGLSSTAFLVALFDDDHPAPPLIVRGQWLSPRPNREEGRWAGERRRHYRHSLCQTRRKRSANWPYPHPEGGDRNESLTLVHALSCCPPFPWENGRSSSRSCNAPRV